MRPRYLVPGILGTAIAGGAWLQARDLPYQEVSAGLGPALFPHVLIGLLAALSLSLAAYGAFAATREEEPAPRSRAARARPLILFGLLVAFGLSIEKIPAVVSVFVFLSLGMILLGEQWARALGYSAAASAFIYLLFGTVFGLPIFSI